MQSNWLNHVGTASSIESKLVPPREVVLNQFGLVTHAHAHLHVIFRLHLLLVLEMYINKRQTRGFLSVQKSTFCIAQETRFQAQES